MVQPRSGWITIPHDDHPVGVLVYGRADFQGLTPLAIHFRPFGTGKLNTLEVAIGYANAESPQTGALQIPVHVIPAPARAPCGRAGLQGLMPLAIHFRPSGTGKLNTPEVAIGYANAESPQTGALQIPVHVIPAPARAAPSCSVHTPRVGTRNDWQANTKTQNKIAHHRPRV